MVGCRRPPPPTRWGSKLIAVDPEAGTIEVAFHARETFLNPFGMVQGGFLAAMLDDTIGAGAGGDVGRRPGSRPRRPTSTCSSSRPRTPAGSSDVAGIVRRGPTFAFMAGELLDEDGNVVAVGSATAYIKGASELAGVLTHARHLGGIRSKSASGRESSRIRDCSAQMRTLARRCAVYSSCGRWALASS